MPAIDYRRARAELRLADVLNVIGYEPRSRLGQQTAWSVSVARLTLGPQPGLLG